MRHSGLARVDERHSRCCLRVSDHTVQLTRREDAGGERLLLQTHHLLLDRVVHDKPHNTYAPQLPDTIRPTHSLLLVGRVPAWFEDHYSRCSSQVEAQTACLGRNQEDICCRLGAKALHFSVTSCANVTSSANKFSSSCNAVWAETYTATLHTNTLGYR